MTFDVFQNNAHHRYDFTPIFENMILFILPLCLAVLFGIWRVIQLSTGSIVARIDTLCLLKSVGS